MLLYDCSTAPSPRRVRIFMAEKSIDIPVKQVDLRNKEQLSDEYRAINPQCDVPFLVLDDGTGIGEVEAVCRYLEDAFPETPLMGTTAKEKGFISMWNHRIEMGGLMAIAEVLRNSSPAFKDRALPGPDNRTQIPELAERGRQRIVDFFQTLDTQLEKTPYIAGEKYSFADITAQVTVDFAAWIKVVIQDSQTHLKKWHDEISARPSAK
ncbi:MAG: glutathione S-transferase [Rhodospirillales bacterium]|nr:glutathione S-transferase [Rhodospirillales bacterium]